MVNSEKYLARIGIGERLLPTGDNLKRIQRAHLFHVPYENLDILLGRPIDLSHEALYDKIVARQRGGYCFEVNELLGWLLRDLGYEVTDFFGRFLRGESGIPMRRHHVLKVVCPDDGEAYLADVGVGTGSPTCPMRLSEGETLREGNLTYRLVKKSFFGWVLEDDRHGDWEAIYSFTEEPQAPIDFAAASFWCEKSPDSIFNKEAMVSLRTQTGRRTIDGDEAREFSGESVSARPLASWDEKRALLRDWFGIGLEENERV